MQQGGCCLKNRILICLCSLSTPDCFSLHQGIAAPQGTTERKDRSSDCGHSPAPGRKYGLLSDAAEQEIPSHFIFKQARANQRPLLFTWRAFASCGALSNFAPPGWRCHSEPTPQHGESARVLTSVTIPDGEDISDHNDPCGQHLQRTVLRTAGDRRELVAHRDVQGVPAESRP